jgi:hypothetical protein
MDLSSWISYLVPVFHSLNYAFFSGNAFKLRFSVFIFEYTIDYYRSEVRHAHYYAPQGHVRVTIHHLKYLYFFLFDRQRLVSFSLIQTVYAFSTQNVTHNLV